MKDMKNVRYESGCAIMGTLTNAQRAQKALSQAAIPSSVSKLEGGRSRQGCVWTVNFSRNQSENVRTVLSSQGISVKSWECES